MKRIVRLTESDLTRLIKRVVNESNRGFINENAQAKGAAYYAKYKSNADAAYNALVGLGNDMWVDDDDINAAYSVISSNIKSAEQYVALCYKFWNTGVDGSSYQTPSDYINVIRKCGMRGGGNDDASLSRGMGELTGKRPHNEKLHSALSSAQKASATLDGGIFERLSAGSSCYGGGPKGGQFAS
jgi:hypothetical protein